MFNRLNKFRFPPGEKVDFVCRKTTLQIEAVVSWFAGQFEINRGGKTLAWIYGSEVVNSDPLVPKAIWELDGSEHLYDVLSIQIIK